MAGDPVVEHQPSLWDTPWLRRQVETHLVFGLFVRRLNLSWMFLALLVLTVLSAFDESWLVLFGRCASAGLLLLLWFPMFRMSKYRQAVIGWFATKTTLAITSSDAIHVTLLALIWLPSIEFIPSLVEHQRFITIGRALLSVPLLLLGSR